MALRTKCSIDTQAFVSYAGQQHGASVGSRAGGPGTYVHATLVTHRADLISYKCIRHRRAQITWSLHMIYGTYLHSAVQVDLISRSHASRPKTAPIPAVQEPGQRK